MMLSGGVVCARSFATNRAHLLLALQIIGREMCAPCQNVYAFSDTICYNNADHKQQQIDIRPKTQICPMNAANATKMYISIAHSRSREFNLCSNPFRSFVGRLMVVLLSANWIMARHVIETIGSGVFFGPSSLFVSFWMSISKHVGLKRTGRAGHLLFWGLWDSSEPRSIQNSLASATPNDTLEAHLRSCVRVKNAHLWPIKIDFWILIEIKYQSGYFVGC